MSHEQKPKRHLYALAVFAILVAILWAGLFSGLSPVNSWYVTMLLMVAFGVVISYWLTGTWRGILIDNRNRISLSRFQFGAWTLLGLSGILTISLNNIVVGSEAPLDFEIPSQLLVLMGISTASLVAAPAIIGTKPKMLTRKSPNKATWADLFLGEEVDNAKSVDLGRMQMFFFTVVVLATYAAQLRSLLMQTDGTIAALPGIQDGMNVLLGISHTGYLAQKNVKLIPEHDS